jgi:hypothetical protein
LFFGRHFVDGSAILVGDSQIAISLNNLATYTLSTYHEFLWWDPTGLDGYPALVNLTHGWFNYLSPLILPSHIFVWIAVSLSHWPLVTAVQVQLFSLAYLSSLIFVVLLSRELTRKMHRSGRISCKVLIFRGIKFATQISAAFAEPHRP